MSLNYLLQRHQISLMRAASASGVDVRRTHQAFAVAYADRIDAMTEHLGGSTARLSRTAVRRD